MKKRNLLLMTGSSLFLLATIAVAADEKMPAFESLDTNKDGYISAEEATPSKDLSEVFVKADADGDGQLNLVEYDSVALAKKQR